MNTKGFTLIEVMIVVVIIGILASVALPSYENYVRRGKITDATSGLSQHRVQMEQFFQDNRNYGTAGAACSPTVPTSNYFTFTCTVGNPNTTFVTTASSKAGGMTATANSYVYTINETNTKETTAFPGRSGTASCWLVRGSEC